MDSLGWVGPEPVKSWRKVHPSDNHVEPRLALELVYQLGQASAHPSEAMMSIQPLQWTGAGFPAFHGVARRRTSARASARPLSWCVRRPGWSSVIDRLGRILWRGRHVWKGRG